MLQFLSAHTAVFDQEHLQPILMFTIIAADGECTLTRLLSPGCRWGRFLEPPSPADLLQDASTTGQEPLQPCPLLAGFLGAWCGCSVLPVEAETFLKIDDLKTKLI